MPEAFPFSDDDHNNPAIFSRQYCNYLRLQACREIKCPILMVICLYGIVSLISKITAVNFKSLLEKYFFSLMCVVR